MDMKEREMGALKNGKEDARVDITRVEGNYREELYKAAKNMNLQMVRNMLEEDKLKVVSDEWKSNPLRGVIMASETRVSVAVILLHHYGHKLLVKAQDPDTGNTLLHFATQKHKEKLAIFFLKYLNELKAEDLDPFAKQCFLDAVNHDGQTALHIATNDLLIEVVTQFVLEKQIKINTKDKNQKTVFDLIKGKCDICYMSNDWKTRWRISILLRGSGARGSSKLSDYEDEEDVKKEERHAERLIMNDDAWNMATNTILLIATLAFTLVFAAIFTVPQTLASSGGGGDATSDPTKEVIHNLHVSLGKSIPFKVFVVSLTLACLYMIFVILVIVLTITSSHHMRALILAFSWSCLIIMGIALIIAYLIAIWIYMGYFFTSILIACGVFIALVLLFFAYYFDLLRHFWVSLSSLLSLTLLHGFVFTFLNTYFPKCFVRPILHICPFED